MLMKNIHFPGDSHLLPILSPDGYRAGTGKPQRVQTEQQSA
jgi:hypothetical protein